MRGDPAAQGAPCPAAGPRPHPAVVADQLFALIAGVGEVRVVAGDAVRAVVHLDVLAPVQGLLAVVAVEALCHGASLRASFTCCETRGDAGSVSAYAARHIPATSRGRGP